MQGGERGGREACLCTSMLHDFMPLRVLFPAVPPFTSQPGKLLLLLQNLANVLSFGRSPLVSRQIPHSLSELPQLCTCLWPSTLSWMCLC